MIVLDASVCIKLFRTEEGSEAAHALREHVYSSGLDIIAPGIMRYEVLGAAIHYGVSFARIAALLGDMQEGGFLFVEPDMPELVLAEEIATAPAPGGRAGRFLRFHLSCHRPVARRRLRHGRQKAC